MGLQLKKHYFFPPGKKIWASLETTSAYQTHFVQRTLAQSMPVYCLTNKYIPIYCRVCRDGQTMMIFPLCRYTGSRRYCVLGKLNGFQIYDILCKPGLTQTEITEMVRFVLEELQAESLIVDYLPENAALYKAVTALAEQGVIRVEQTVNENVIIHADEGYDPYYAALSKSTRQNIRTAYNRLSKAELPVRLEVVAGKPLPGALLDQILEIYCDRHQEHYGVATPPIKRFYLRHLDFSTRCLQHSPDNFYAILYLGDRIAAFMAGLVNTDGKSIIIPRLSISHDFLPYSPGVVLINETVKHMTSHMGITRLDLSKGAEKYKFSMGGRSYPTYFMQIFTEKG